MSKSDPNLGAVGIAWYREADYARLRAMFEDGDVLHDTWEEWLKTANDTVAVLERDEAIVERVIIEPDEFLAWCTARGMPLNAKTRGTFAGEFVYRKYNKTT